VSDIIIRRFAPDDLLPVIDVEKNVYGSAAYLPLFLRQLVDLFPSLIWVAEADSKVVGHICGAVGEDSETGWLINVGVLARYRRQGVGYRLMRQCADQLLALGVTRIMGTAEVENGPMIRLYERLGFREVGRGSDYYGDGRERLIVEYIR